LTSGSFNTYNIIMDESSRLTLEEILSRDINSLTDYDKAFLRARRSYLSEDQMKYIVDTEPKVNKKK